MGRRAAARRGDSPGTQGLTLDAGALIALERADPRVRSLVRKVLDAGRTVRIPAGALAQAWRGTPRQQPLWLLIADAGVSIAPLDPDQALAVGRLLASTRSRDVIDASVVLTARKHSDSVVTSDPDDLHRLDPTLPIIDV
jgi:predicted nucleic acid-binding protein